MWHRLDFCLYWDKMWPEKNTNCLCNIVETYGYVFLVWHKTLVNLIIKHVKRWVTCISRRWRFLTLQTLRRDEQQSRACWSFCVWSSLTNRHRRAQTNFCTSWLLPSKPIQTHVSDRVGHHSGDSNTKPGFWDTNFGSLLPFRAGNRH